MFDKSKQIVDPFAFLYSKDGNDKIKFVTNGEFVIAQCKFGYIHGKIARRTFRGALQSKIKMIAQKSKLACYAQHYDRIYGKIEEPNDEWSVETDDDSK